MKLVEIIFLIIGVGISQFWPASLFHKRFSDKLNSKPIWQFWIIMTVVISSILIFFLHPIFKELSDLFPLEFIAIGLLFPIGFVIIYYSLKSIVKATLEKIISLLTIISYAISVTLLVIIMVYIYGERRRLSYDINDYNIDTIDSTVNIPQMKFVYYAEKHMKQYSPGTFCFKTLFKLKFIIEHTDSSNIMYKNIYDTLNYNLNAIIYEYDSIKNMSSEKDSIVGRFIYARLKQGRKVRYGVLLEYKDSKEIIKINKTEYEIISDFDLSRHPLLCNFHKKINWHYKYYVTKEDLIDDKFEEVLDAEAIRVFEDYNIDLR